MQLNTDNQIQSQTSDKKNVENEIILKIRELIVSDALQPGDRLPAERNLAEQFGVSRNQLRQAIQKLEFYGLVQKFPQSGTRVSNIGVTALNGMMTDILELQQPDFKSLVETRMILESNAVKLAAQRRTDEQINQIMKAHQAYSEKAINGVNAVEEDLLFHLKLAEASNNSVIYSLMLVITPEIITHFVANKVCNKDENYLLIKEHQSIIDAIIDKKPEKAVDNLNGHFKDLKKFCYDS